MTKRLKARSLIATFMILSAAALQAQAPAKCGVEPDMKDYTIYKGRGKSGYAAAVNAYYACVNDARKAQQVAEKGAQPLAEDAARDGAAKAMKQRFEQIAGLESGGAKMSPESTAAFNLIQGTSESAFAVGAAGRGVPSSIAQASTNSAVDAGKALAATFETALSRTNATVSMPSMETLPSTITLNGSSDPATSMAGAFESARSSSDARAISDQRQWEQSNRDYQARVSALSTRAAELRQIARAEEQARADRAFHMRLQEVQAKSYRSTRSSSSGTSSGTSSSSTSRCSECGKAQPPR